jgi:hypothetical protein
VAVLGLLVYRIWAFPHWQVYSYSTTSLLLILAAILCQLRWSDAPGPERRAGWLVGAGVLFGLSVYCKQDYGAAALLVMTTLLCVEARASGVRLLKPVALFVGAGAAVGACVGLYFAAQGILPDLLQQTVLNHLRGIGAFEYTSYPALFPLFAQDPDLRSQSGLFAFFPGIVTTVDLETLRQNFLFRETFVYDLALKLFYWGGYGFAAFAVVRVVATRRKLSAPETARAWLAEAMLAGFTAAFILLLTVNRPQDFLHVAVLVWPGVCLCVVYAPPLFQRRRALAIGLCVVLAAPMAAVLGYAVRGYWLVLNQNSEPVTDPRAGIFVRPSEAQMLDDVVDFMRDNSTPDERVAVVPYFPIVHFLADRRGPHRSAYIVWPFAEFEDRDQRIIDALDETDTRLAVYNFSQFSTFPSMDEFSPQLFGYLVDEFETVRVFSYDKSGYRLAGLRRSAQREMPSALLDEVWNDSVLWIGSDEAPPVAIPPRERAGFMAREAWPFRRTLALRPSSGGRRTVLRIPIRPAEGDVLQTAVSLHPDLWFVVPGFETHFELAVVTNAGAAEQREVVFSRTLDPHRDLVDRGWFDVKVPLVQWVDTETWLEMSVAVDSEVGELLRVGGFAEPRIVSSLGDLGPAPGAVAD